MATYLNYPFDEELFTQMWNEEPDPVKTALLESGVMVEDSLIAQQIQGDGNLYTIPFYNVLSGDPVNYDGATDITSEETTADSQSGIVYGRAKGFTARDFVAELSGANPMGHIASTIGKYWQKQRQNKLIQVLNAIFAITGGAAGSYQKEWVDKHTADVSSTTAEASKIGATDLNHLATQAMGDNKSKFAVAIMHSSVAETLENLQVLEYWKQTDANGIQRPTALASCNGYTVIIDDGVPNEAVGGTGANKDLVQYTTYLIGEGALRTASGRVDHPSEVSRDPKTNGGQDTLYTRMRETIHPNGFSFKIPSSGWTNSPTDAQLSAAANWSVKFNPKAIPIARLITNG